MNILMFIVGLVILVGVLKILTFPLRLIGKFVINSIIGMIALVVLAKIGITLVIAWWSILLVGILGIPGVIIAVMISIFI